jgi:hypothetical protein
MQGNPNSPVGLLSLRMHEATGRGIYSSTNYPRKISNWQFSFTGVGKYFYPKTVNFP